MSNPREADMNAYHELAAAMRKGAALRPQAFTDYFRVYKGTLCSCALGAVYEAVTGRTDIHFYDDDGIPESDSETMLALHFGIPPGTSINGTALVTLITRMNDDREMTREAIADWLDTL